MGSGVRIPSCRYLQQASEILEVCLAILRQASLFLFQSPSFLLKFRLFNFCFTKLLHPLVKRWRSMGHCYFVFLDDGISEHPERVSASAASLLHQKDLKLNGLKLNREKSLSEPMQVGQWLGFVIDTIKMQFRVPPKKIAKLKRNLDSMISSGSATFRELAQVAGFINSLYLNWQSALLLGYSRGRCMQLFKPVCSGIAPFLFLRPYQKNCVSGLLISRPLTDMEFSLSLLQVQ